ncbi:GGDEF domain-containing protein [Shewanella submarina]|nr:GGDEF domain-containing protein [Shewanella submarina]MCL1037347.1 GGDEF domain-containing protein [Shewanella submarina]
MNLTGLIKSAGGRILLQLMAAIILIITLNPLREVTAPYPELVLLFPYLLLGTVLLLSQLFNQLRTGFLAVLMLLAYAIIQLRLQQPLPEANTRFAYQLLALMMPLNLLLVLAWPARRLLSPSGFGFLLFIGLQLVAGYWLTGTIQPEPLLSWRETYLMTPGELTPLPILLLLLGLVAICGAALVMSYRNTGADMAALTCLIATELTLVYFQESMISSLAFSLCGVLLIINLIYRSHELAFIDSLTQIPGRRALENEMKHLGRHYALAMMDVDHFKKFNDTYGHKMGDDVLRLMGKLMQDYAGKARVYRYGGEEFTMLFKGQDARACEDHLNEFREAVADYPLAIRDEDRDKDDQKGKQRRGTKSKVKTVNVTISIGVADYQDGKTPQEVMKVADELLYKAKKAGRNCVVTS